jgi:hypothetical protein
MHRKINPKSLENLRMGQSPGRKTAYDAPKHPHGVSLTDEAWQGLRNTAQSVGTLSVSELLERLGRGQLTIVEVNTMDSVTDALAGQDAPPEMTQEDLDWVDSDLSDLANLEVYDWGVEGLPKGKPITYVPGEGFKVMGGKASE